ncbi:MAG: toll/interleukin-1 receptor domain-containing protein [Chloroflexota bacterium]
MPTQSIGHVFISYSRKDNDVMRRIVAFLRKQGIKIWLDNENLIPGTPIWEEEIEKAINTASAVVVVMSPDSKNSEWVRREISLADQNRLRIFPVLVRGDEETSVTLRLITRQHIDLRENEDAGLNTLHTALAQFLDEQERAAPKRLVSESAEQGIVEKDEREQALDEAADKTASEKISTELDFRKASENPDIEKTSTPRNISQAVIWFALGWAIAGGIGGFIYNIVEDNIFGYIISGGIGGFIGGLVTLTALRNTGILSRQKNMIRTVSGWAISGAIGWTVGFELTEAIGAGIGMAVFAMIGLVSTLGIDYIRSNWKNSTVIALAWVLGEAIGWLIARRWLIDALDIDQATSWAIGTAIGWGFGGFVMGWQLLKNKSNS